MQLVVRIMNRDISGLVDEQIKRSQMLQRAAGRITEGTPPPGPVITISRQLGSGGTLIARRLAEQLGWGLWDKELVDAIAKDASVSRRIVESFDEKTVSEIDVLARTLTGEPEVGGFLYRRHLVRTLLSIARHGNAIILGRGANFLLPKALNIRIVACEQTRVKRVMGEEDLSREQALERIRNSDHERQTFVRNIYGRDVNDPLAYDLVIASDSFTEDSIIAIILAALQAKVAQ